MVPKALHNNRIFTRENSNSWPRERTGSMTNKIFKKISSKQSKNKLSLLAIIVDN
jgi:hypothetical protein